MRAEWEAAEASQRIIAIPLVRRAEFGAPFGVGGPCVAPEGCGGLTGPELDQTGLFHFLQIVWPGLDPWDMQTIVATVFLRR